MKIIFTKKVIKESYTVKKLSKYVTVFDYVDKVLIALSATSGGVYIILFTSVVGAPVGIASSSFTLIFSLSTGIVKKLLAITRKKKEHDKVLMLAKIKLINIETLISEALIDMEISHEEFIAIFKEKDKYEKVKENLRSENEKQEIMRLSRMKSNELKKKLSQKQSKIIKHFMPSKNFIFFLCMYKMVDISAKIWNKAKVSVMKIQENNNVNKTVLLLLCIFDTKKDGAAKIFMT